MYYRFLDNIEFEDFEVGIVEGEDLEVIYSDIEVDCDGLERLLVLFDEYE